MLSRLRDSSQKLVDMGCCFGQSLRKMIYDGAPATSLYGIDIESDFISLGFELFRDRDKLESTFIVADVFNLDLSDLGEEFNIVHVSAFFHLFPRHKQLLAVQTLIKLLRPQPNSIVMGANLGSLKPGEYQLTKDGSVSFRHNPETFRELWNEAAAFDGSKWRVESSLDTVSVIGNEHMPWAEPNIRRIVFTATRE